MTMQRMEHVGIVVDDLAAATEFFVELRAAGWQARPNPSLAAHAASMPPGC